VTKRNRERTSTVSPTVACVVSIWISLSYKLPSYSTISNRRPNRKFRTSVRSLKWPNEGTLFCPRRAQSCGSTALDFYLPSEVAGAHKTVRYGRCSPLNPDTGSKLLVQKAEWHRCTLEYVVFFLLASTTYYYSSSTWSTFSQQQRKLVVGAFYLLGPFASAARGLLISWPLLVQYVLYSSWVSRTHFYPFFTTTVELHFVLLVT